jgi:predicted permease
MGFTTIISQISFLAILSICGILAYRFKVLNNSAKDVIEKLVFYVTLPLLIITKLSSLSFTSEILRNGLFILFGTYLVLFLQILAGKLSARIFKLNQSQASVHILHTTFGNIVFLGFPLLDALFPGGEAILYAGIFQLAQNTVTWTYGIHILNPASKEKGLKNLKKLLNPNIIALCLGLVMMAFRIQFPQIIQAPLQGLGKTTIYLSMIYIGILMAQIKIKEMINSFNVFVLSINKLILLPIIFIFLFRFLINVFNLQINNIAFSVLILEASMPCMAILVILAKRYGADDKLAMKNFFISTVMSLVSLPLILYLLQI